LRDRCAFSQVEWCHIVKHDIIFVSRVGMLRYNTKKIKWKAII